MSRVIIAADYGRLDATAVIAALQEQDGSIVVIDYKTIEGELEMHNRRVQIMGLGIALAASLVGPSAVANGHDAMRVFANSDPGPTFGQRYGANPRSTENGGLGRGNDARSKREAAKRRNVQARANKQRPAKLARKIAAKQARRYA